MSVPTNLNTHQYTVGNAIFSGMCRHHLMQSYVQTQWRGRIVHLILGVLEALPIVGQIISLLELGVITFFSRTQPTAAPKPRSFPEPTSCRPRLTLRRYQEISTDVCRYWPTDLTLLGITETQRAEIDGHIRDAFRAGSIVIAKKKITYHNKDNSVNVSVDLPLSFMLIKVNGSQQCILLPKTVFITSGERKIRWAYNLMTGEFLLKKRIVGLFEEKIVSFLAEAQQKRGLSHRIMWRTSSGKAGEKQQMIESLRDGTMLTLFNTAPLQKLSTKQGMIIDLLQNLYILHNTSISNVSLTVKSPIFPYKEESVSLPPFASYHLDIKAENVLVSLIDGIRRAELCDFGYAASNPRAITLSVGYTPPEYIQFYSTERPHGISKDHPFLDSVATIKFNIKYAQKRDIWSMGLVLLSVLVGRIEKVSFNTKREMGSSYIAPLPSLKAYIEGCNPWTNYVEEGLLNLTQETLDKEIAALELEVKQNHKDEAHSVGALFNIVKNMLRIRPQERLSVPEILFNYRQDSAAVGT